MGRTDPLRRRLAVGAVAASTLWLAGHRRQDEDALLSAESLAAGLGALDVFIDRRGPFRFAVDTAAGVSVIASDLARALALGAGGELTLHTVAGRERAATAVAMRLECGALSRENVRLAVGERRGLTGLDGLIGLDLLAGLRLVMRFRGRRRYSLSRSRPDPDAFFGAVRPRVNFEPLRPGSPIRLMTTRLTVGDVSAAAVIDTGAEVSLINMRLARAAGARPVALRSAETGRSVQSPTGRLAPAEPMAVSRVRFDALALDRLGVLAGDFHIFDHLGLADTPAILIGVDVLGVFDRVSIDLNRGEIVMNL